MNVVNLLDAARGDELAKGVFRHFGQALRPQLGGELIGCGLYDIPPEAQLWPYHWHTSREEWLIVVAGAPTLRTPDGERELTPGEIVAFPAGEAGAHTLFNRTEGSVRVAIFSTLHSGVSVYPDSGKIGVPGHVFRVADAVDYWDGEEGI
jgi:uncharacterized cupin superfamily protein